MTETQPYLGLITVQKTDDFLDKLLRSLSERFGIQFAEQIGGCIQLQADVLAGLWIITQKQAKLANFGQVVTHLLVAANAEIGAMSCDASSKSIQ